ncbi:protein SPMIP2 [Rhynchocyon petersi]
MERRRKRNANTLRRSRRRRMRRAGPGQVQLSQQRMGYCLLDALGTLLCPDYVKDHLPKLHLDSSYIGEKQPIAEKTGNLEYLWRPDPHRSLPAKYKHNYVGEIGWGIPECDFISKSHPESDFHIKYGELSHACMDYLTHRYQNPWQPKPPILDMQGKYSRGFLAWHMGYYEDTTERHHKWSTLVRESKAPPTSKLPKLPPKFIEANGQTSQLVYLPTLLHCTVRL